MNEQLAKEITAHYRDLPDPRLRDLAMREAKDLSSMGLELLGRELLKRGMPIDLEVCIDAQTRPLAADELDLLVALAQRQPCSECNATDQPVEGLGLSATLTRGKNARRRQRVILVCPACRRKALRGACMAALTLSWWSPTWPWLTPAVLLHNLRCFFRAGRAASLREHVKARYVDYRLLAVTGIRNGI